MTDDEKRRQKGELLLSFQEAVDNAAALRQELKSLQNVLSGVVEWIESEVRNIPIGQSRESVWSRSLASTVNVTTDPMFRKAMDLDRLIEIHGQNVAAQKRVDELRASKTELGLK